MASAQEFREAEEASRDAAMMSVLCAFCEWSYEGTAAECREEAAAHRAQAHPEATAKRRPRSRPSLHTFRSQNMDDDDRAEIQNERLKRARLHGVEIEE